MTRPDLLDRFLTRQPFAVLDGGLATELEREGMDLFDPIWSAKALLEAPAKVQAVHRDYLVAGADIIATASYQATIPGLMAKGLSAAKAAAVIQSSVVLARRARDEFVAAGLTPDRQAPLVAGSVGSYGAYRHDGSEYTGDYRLTDREYKDFHRPRLQLLAEAGVDLIACETIPTRREGEVLADLLESFGGPPGWVSFTAKDEVRIADGSAFADCVASISGAQSVLAVGINCSPLGLVAGLFERARSVASKPFVAYPNAGGVFHADTGQWIGDPNAEELPEMVPRWVALGAKLIGGCCRAGPAAIAGIRQRLHQPNPQS